MTTKTPVFLSQFESPLGKVAVAERKGRVLGIWFGGRRQARSEHPELWDLGEVIEGTVAPAAKQIQDYLAGKVGRLRIPVDYSLVKSDFDRTVLERLYKLRAGQTVYYAELAAMVGRPGAARAVGSAMRRNPIPILVPCHRVLPQSGGLGNYTGGTEKKAWLLAREGVSPDAG